MPRGQISFHVKKHFNDVVKNILLKDFSMFTCSCSHSHAHKLKSLHSHTCQKI